MARRDQERDQPDQALPSWRIVHIRDGRSTGPRRGPSQSATTTYPALICALVIVPEAANLIADNARAWTVWLTLTQASMMGLCFLALKAPKNYAMRVCWVAAALWYMVQALDEALAGNLFSDSTAEYIVFLAYCIAITLHIRTHERSERTT